MPVQNRISISLTEIEYDLIHRAANRQQQSQAQIIRTIIKEFFDQNPDRFKLPRNATTEL